MLILETFGPNFGEAEASPFCLKAMCLLKMAGVDWTAAQGSDSRKAPARKLPVLHDGSETIPDSDSIRTHLEKRYGVDFDASLSEAQKAQSRALIRMVEEHLYFCLVYDRWKVDKTWQHVKGAFFSDLPLPLRVIVPRIARKSVLSDLDGQGIGRLSYEDMLERAKRVLVNVASTPENSLLKQAVLNNARLSRYITDAKQAFFPVA